MAVAEVAQAPRAGTRRLSGASLLMYLALIVGGFFMVMPFVYFQMGYASAMAYVLFVVVLAFKALEWVMQKRWVHY